MIRQKDVRPSLLTIVGCLALASCGDETVEASPPPPVSVRDGGTDSGGNAKSLRVATFNVRRFFDTTCDSGQCGATEFEEAFSQTAFDDKAREIARGIERIDPDVVGLQEIEDQAVLDALVQRLTADGYAFSVAKVGETGAPGSLDVAVLARNGTVLETRSHKDDPLERPDGSSTTFTRDLLELHLSFGKTRVIFLTAHFRSKAGTDDVGRRIAEATATRTIMTALSGEFPAALIALGGDLNDEPGSQPLSALEEGGALVRLAKDLPTSQQTTFVFQGRAEAIDHLYATKASAAHFVSGSATVVRDDASGLGGSDHAALRADFTVQ